jgi:hypothetical protein
VAYAAGSTPSEGRSTRAPVDRQASPWFERAVAAVDRNWRWALAVLLLVDGVLLLYMGRGLTFFYDDWNFVTEDYGGGIHSLLRAHVGNISVFPIAIYKVLFHLVGLNHYAVFRCVAIVLHLICGGLVFVLASRRVPRVPALLAAALILFLGAAWEDLLWAFQIGYLLSVAGGLAAWVLLERRSRPAEIAAMLCLVVSVGSSSLGIAVIIGVAVELTWERRWQAGWIVVVPALLYVLWYLGYGESQVTSESLMHAPGFAADLAAAAFGGLVGRGLEWGRPLAVVGLLVLLGRLARPLPVSARLAGLIATGVSLWIVTAAARSTISTPETSRYIYLGAVVIVLIGVELLRGVAIALRVSAVAAVVVAGCAVTGLTVLHDGAMNLHATSKTVTADLGALELAAAYAPPGYQPDPQGAPQILAGPYLHTVRSIGSTPADTAAQIITSEAGPRAAADTVLVQLGAIKLEPLGAVKSSALAPAPATVSLVGAQEVQSGGCLRLAPIPGAQMSGVFTLPAGGVLIRNQGSAPVSFAAKRFGETFIPLPDPLNARSLTVVSIPLDATQVPWQLQVTTASPFLICRRQPQ